MRLGTPRKKIEAKRRRRALAEVRGRSEKCEGFYIYKKGAPNHQGHGLVYAISVIPSEV